MYIQRMWSINLAGYSSVNAGEKWMNFKKLNLIVGPNNSGKSRLLRTLFSSKNKDMSVGVGDVAQSVVSGIEDIMDVIKNCPAGIMEFDCIEFLRVCDGQCRSVEEICAIVSNFIKLASNTNLRVSGGAGLREFNIIRGRLQHENVSDIISGLTDFNSRLSNVKKHYIPILRGMRPLDGGKDLFLERTQTDYFSGNDGLNIITGFDLYSLLARFLLGQPDERNRVREYEKILGNEFFGGADITLIPQYGKDTVAVKIGDDAQFSIFDIGDGLQQVIIITSAAYLEKQNSIFFIEEPESCLHPGLLRKLALFLLSHTDHQYVATTHSNHLLDLAESCEDVLIHRVAKRGGKDGNDFYIQECTKDRDILADLGVRASSVYLANSTIWVEGVTDRKYLKVIMKKYLSSKCLGDKKNRFEGFLENYHYVFVEYQGGTLGHWGFDDDDDTTDRLKASRLCSDAFLIADGDILSKSERAQKLTLELQDRFHLLPGKEIENLLPANVVLESAKRIFKRKISKTKDGLNVEALSGILKVNLAVSKQGIGFHLDRALGLKGKGKAERRVFADESGTINDKVKFCHQTIQVMDEIEWELSAELIDLCEKIYSHIDLKN